ncbi:MAG: hypothetical protein HQM09_22670 [Candidatus Riflebacteria bacterium]|nr:hypothetical protein [Candidatus Riflebacteria bacterium]
MSLFNFSPGDSVLMPTPPGMVRHLWFLCFVLKDGQEGIFVNLTDSENSEDNTVILNPGDHPFVIKKSVILYSRAMVFKRKNIETLLDKGIIFPNFPASEGLLSKINKGFMSTSVVPEPVRLVLPV